MLSQSAVKAVFCESLQLKPYESCLIVYDPPKRAIAQALYACASTIAERCEMLEFPVASEHAEEPPAIVGERLKSFDIAVMVTSYSLSHTAARRRASKAGVRIASMPMITEEIINRCVDIDYYAMKKKAVKIAQVLENTEDIRICTEKGTDFFCKRRSRTVYGSDAGVFNTPGAFGNLPEGEVCFGPLFSRGVFVVDISFPGCGLLKSPLSFYVSRSRVYKISGEQSDVVQQRLVQVGQKAFYIAELGFGINPKAILTGNVLEDEKALGTIHIALGNNRSFGGSNNINVHLDGVISNPDIFFDSKIVMCRGKWNIT